MEAENTDLFEDLYEEGTLNHLDLDDDDDESELLTLDKSNEDDKDLQINGLVSVPHYDDDDDEDEDDDDEENEQEKQKEAPTGVTKSPIIDQLLESKGIKDSLVQFENEDGEIETVDFYTLSEEEQVNILKSSDQDINFGLAEDEIETINFLRSNNVSFEDTVEYFKRQAVQEYIDSQNITGIEVDQYTDEDLFAIDLKAKYDELTEEEIQIELSKQLEHPELFKKKVDKLRTDYKKIEEEQKESVRLEQEQLEEQKQQELTTNLITVAQSIEDIGGLDLDNNDKNEVLSFILDKDINGMTPFLKTLDSPKQLFELAWYATKGKEAFEIVHEYYKKEIEKVRRTTYDKAKAELTKKPATAATTKGKSYVKPRSNSNNSPKINYPSIDDLQID